MTYGIYILANDVVYDQLVALLNSIEANAGREIPICIIPYDHRLDKVKAEIARRKQVSLFEDQDAIDLWEGFSTQAWKAHHRAQTVWQERGIFGIYRLAMHRKLCGLSGKFDKFIYFDADTLLMGPIDAVYEKLDHYDWVTNDFQYRSDIKYIFDRPKEQLVKVFDPAQLESHIFCAGWFASKKGVFPSEQREELLNHLKAGEADVMALFGPDQSLFNYMVMRSQISYYNFAYHDVGNAVGNHWSSQFENIDQVLYDKGKRLTYIHYMSVSSTKFTQLCAGKDVEIPYRDVFLHYRYLNCPEEHPQSFFRPNFWEQIQRHIKNHATQKSRNLKYRFQNFKQSLDTSRSHKSIK